MLVEEADWLAARIAALSPAHASPILNVGSGTREDRSVRFPWIESRLLEPLRAQGHTFVHLDGKEGLGVDVVGDLTDPGLWPRLGDLNVRSVLCANVVEHVPQREVLATRLAAVIPPGGYLVVTAPHRYPFHPDPIDSLFRPTPRELAALFAGTRLLEGEVVTSAPLQDYLSLNRAGPAGVSGWLAGWHRPRRWVGALAQLPWLRRPFQASCVVLQKETEVS